VRFEKPHYFINEKESIIEPILLLSGKSSFDITVRIIEIDGSATGK